MHVYTVYDVQIEAMLTRARPILEIYVWENHEELSLYNIEYIWYICITYTVIHITEWINIID